MSSDEQVYDSRNPPWMDRDEYPEMFPAAQLLTETGDTVEMLEAPESEARIPQGAPQAQGPGQQAQGKKPRRQPMSREERRRLSKETQADRREEIKQERIGRKEKMRGGVAGGFNAGGLGGGSVQDADGSINLISSEAGDSRHVPRNWMPPGASEHEAASMIDIPDEVPLTESRTVAREDPGAAMEDDKQWTDFANRQAETSELTAHWLHNSLSRIRDQEASLMRINYV